MHSGWGGWFLDFPTFQLPRFPTSWHVGFLACQLLGVPTSWFFGVVATGGG